MTEVISLFDRSESDLDIRDAARLANQRVLGRRATEQDIAFCRLEIAVGWADAKRKPTGTLRPAYPVIRERLVWVKPCDLTSNEVRLLADVLENRVATFRYSGWAQAGELDDRRADEHRRELRALAGATGVADLEIAPLEQPFGFYRLERKLALDLEDRRTAGPRVQGELRQKYPIMRHGRLVWVQPKRLSASEARTLSAIIHYWIDRCCDQAESARRIAKSRNDLADAYIAERDALAGKHDFAVEVLPDRWYHRTAVTAVIMPAKGDLK